MKKILIASYNLGYGGIETSLINLLKIMNLNKYDITVVLEKKEGVFLKDIPIGIKVKEYNVSNSNNIIIRKSINFLKRLKWLVSNYHKYDASICYATYSGPCGFVARTSSKNSILFVHSNYYEAFNKDKTKTINFFNQLKIMNYNHIIFVSNESKRDLISLYPNIKNKSVTINNIVDYKKVIDLSKEKINILKENKKIFLFIGRLDESSKRLTLLLEVAKKCKKENVDSIFWIVGNGPDELMYKKIVKENNLNNVIFIGAKKNPYPYIKKCDYLILTSRYEGFPVVYNEAIILEKPIITTVDVTDDFISIPKRFGYIVDENSIFDIVKDLSLKKDLLVKEKVNYDKLNKKRIKSLEKIMESNDD